ncbi:hypothetical protein HBI04_015110 [Parastagonospora nodorum]|nr:hypothetical protein HBI03_182160 [Parastagonospora nodorum]KAH4282825.1 hypothetical protein HBI04_015110 [Parastagonospora nodorum]KAH5233137.1 hypothetical protein HBI62_059690 [Parastagonospora nodorum]KAH6126060.1 hypothetical protein HBI69_037230 [Parastagonospora nodorum]KAH6160491.1 hypothetical protein HBI63_056280 [Parastagonospora nodorum]
MGTMGKNKNKSKNKSRKSDENFRKEATDAPEKRIVPVTASSLTTSSSFASRDPSPTHRTSDSTSELPILPSCSGPVGQSILKANDEKRDSVISSTWEGRKQSLASMLEPVTPHVWGLRPRRWWPCRTYRWTKDLLFALGRACTGPRWYDLLLTLFTVAAVMFAGYVALELGLSMLKTASAQDTSTDTGCSVVYVTVPGPIITISLINASPSNPAKGTYYFSVVNGTTEWMNSITPPSQFSTLITKTPEITPIISSVSVAPSSGTSLTFSTVPSTTSQYATPPSIATSSLSTLPSSTLSSPSSGTISSVTITATSIVTGGQTTIITRVTETTIEGAPPRPTSSTSLPITSTVITTLISTTPNGSTTTSVVTSTTNIVVSPPASPSSMIIPTTMSSTSTLTSTISNTPTMITSIISSVQTTTMTLPSTMMISAPSSPILPSTSSVPRSPSSTTSTQGSSFTISLPSPSPAPGSTAATSAPSVITSTVTRVTSGFTTTLTQLSTTSAPAIFSSTLASSASSLSVPVSSTSSAGTSSAPSSSIFTWPSSSAPQSPGASSAGIPSMTSSSSSSSSLAASSSWATLSITVASSASSSSSATIPSSTGTLATSVLPTVSSSTSPLNTSSSSTSILSSSSSRSRISTSTTTGGVPGATSPSMFSSLVPPMNTTSSSSSRLTSSSSSSSPLLPDSSSVISATTSGSSTSTRLASSSSISNPASGTLPAGSSAGSITMQTDTTTHLSSPSSIITSPISAVPTVSTSSVDVQGLTTKVISYGDTEFSFVFPSPDITTTISYWTGANPIATGPLPSDLQTVVPTTRSTTQTPISALPSFSIFSSRPRSFKTVVTTIYDDDGPDKRDVKREAIPQVLEPLLTTTVEIASPTSAGISEPPGPTTCGESGNFTLNFDDTTVSSTGDEVHAVHGLRNPYHHLFYANGYTDMPDKWEPYPAMSQPNVAMFLPVTGKVRPNQPFAGTLLPGELGAGPRASVDAYWFNAYSGYFGCALNGVTPCLLRISGFRYDATLQTEVLVAEQNATLPVCPLYVRCRLTQVFFNEQFRALSGIQFNAFTAGLKIPQIHMLDDLQLEWYNNTCSAGILRIGHS